MEKLGGHVVRCQIVNSHAYALHLHGGGYKPRLDLSAYSHDFGSCLVWRQGMPATTYTLRVTNNDRQLVSFDPHYSGGDHMQVGAGGSACSPSACLLHTPVELLATNASSARCHSCLPQADQCCDAPPQC